MAHCLVNYTAIPCIEFVEHALDRDVEYVIEYAVLLLQLEQLRTEHGSQGKCRHSRYRKDNTHHPAQLFEHDTHHTTSQRHGEEHGNHRKRRSDNGDGHLIGSMDSSLLGVGTTLDVGSNVLQHHNSIVHHHTDGNRKTGQRNHIQRSIGDSQIDERGHQRNGNGNGNHEGGTPTSEEEEYHDNYEQESIEHGLNQTADRVLNVL